MRFKKLLQHAIFSWTFSFFVTVSSFIFIFLLNGKLVKQVFFVWLDPSVNILQKKLLKFIVNKYIIFWKMGNSFSLYLFLLTMIQPYPANLCSMWLVEMICWLFVNNDWIDLDSKHKIVVLGQQFANCVVCI